VKNTVFSVRLAVVVIENLDPPDHAQASKETFRERGNQAMSFGFRVP
jgi:hypothetical protein